MVIYLSFDHMNSSWIGDFKLNNISSFFMVDLMMCRLRWCRSERRLKRRFFPWALTFATVVFFQFWIEFLCAFEFTIISIWKKKNNFQSIQIRFFQGNQLNLLTSFSVRAANWLVYFRTNTFTTFAIFYLLQMFVEFSCAF